jgi:hypothetical protein
MWALSDPGESPAPANTPSAFNTVNPGETRLDAQILQGTNFRLGIADYRGDGRPDYRYQARVLYGDNLSPQRASAAGDTPLTIGGLGLEANTGVQVAGVPVPALATSATQVLVNSPPVPDGSYDVLLEDSASGGQSDMTAVLTVGAGPTDTLKLISGSNPATVVGGQAPAPFTAMAIASDGTTPIAGASIQFTSSPAVAFSVCGGASSCTVLSDASGIASTYMTVLSANVITLTAKLAPASYANPQQVQGTLLGTSSQLDLALITPPIWIAQGASATLPVQARVMSNGSPVPGAALSFQITGGTGALSASSGQTDANGSASVNLQVTSLAASVRVTVCVAPSNSPCQVLNVIIAGFSCSIAAGRRTSSDGPTGWRFPARLRTRGRF